MSKVKLILINQVIRKKKKFKPIYLNTKIFIIFKKMMWFGPHLKFTIAEIPSFKNIQSVV